MVWLDKVRKTAATLSLLAAGCSPTVDETAADNGPDTIELSRHSAMAGLAHRWKIGRSGTVEYTTHEGDELVIKHYEVGTAGFERIVHSLTAIVEPPPCDFVWPDPSGGYLALSQGGRTERFEFVETCQWNDPNERRAGELFLMKLQTAEDVMRGLAAVTLATKVERATYEWPPRSSR